MDARSIRRTLNLAACACLALGAAALGLSIALPLREFEGEGALRTRAPRGAGGATKSVLSEKSPELTRELLAGARLRTELFDPPPKLEAPAPKVERPPPPLRLVGTVLGRDPIAILQDPSGKTELRRRGERVGSDGNVAEVREIRGGVVVLDHYGKTVELKREEKPR